MSDKKFLKTTAAALKYNIEMDNAPRVTAYGKGIFAKKILEKAQKNNIPVYKDSALAEALGNLKIGAEIPKELYEVVSQVLVFISKMDKEI